MEDFCFSQNSFLFYSSKIIGTEDLSNHLKESIEFNVSLSNLNWNIVLTLLLRPGDGKADNYGVEKDETRESFVLLELIMTKYFILLSIVQGIKCIQD